MAKANGGDGVLRPRARESEGEMGESEGEQGERRGVVRGHRARRGGQASRRAGGVARWPCARAGHTPLPLSGRRRQRREVGWAG